MGSVSRRLTSVRGRGLVPGGGTTRSLGTRLSWRPRSHSTSTMSRPSCISSAADYELALRVSDQQLVVLLFSTSWCEFCQMIRLYLDEFAECYPDVAFYEVDISVAKEVVQRCRIEWFPTFQFYKNGSKVFQFKGPNRCLLERMIQKLQGSGARSYPELHPAGS